MNTAQTLIFAAITKAQLSVKQIASACSISETSVRDNLKKLEGVCTDGGKPALFWIPAPSEVIEAAPAEEAAQTNPDAACPFCPADASSITAAGEDYTFLGDSCGFCHECGRTHNLHTKEEVFASGSKAKRVILNPQPMIDKKAEELEALGASQSYASRTWTISYKGQVRVLSSRQYAAFKSGAELVALF